MTVDAELDVIIADLAAHDEQQRREANAYRVVFHFVLGFLERPRMMDTAEVVALMQAQLAQEMGLPETPKSPATPGPI